MLKKINPSISPQLLKILAEMGHGDELVIADGNFPSHSISQNVIRADGLGAAPLLKGILELFPLDQFPEYNVYLMDVPQGSEKPEIWKDYKQVLEESEEKYSIKYLERFAFYEQARKSYAVLATGEKRLYANIIIKKGTC